MNHHILRFNKRQVAEIREGKPGEDAMKTGWLKCHYSLGKMLRYGKPMGTYSKVIPIVQAEY